MTKNSDLGERGWWRKCEKEFPDSAKVSIYEFKKVGSFSGVQGHVSFVEFGNYISQTLDNEH